MSMALLPDLVQQSSFSYAKATTRGNSTDSCHFFWLHRECKPAMMVEPGWAAQPKQLHWQLLLCSGRKDQARAQAVCTALYPRRVGRSLLLWCWWLPGVCGVPHLDFPLLHTHTSWSFFPELQDCEWGFTCPHNWR